MGEAGRCHPAAAAGQRAAPLDELRRGDRGAGPGAYDELSYFERWISARSATCCWRRASSACRSWVRRSPRRRPRHAAAVAGMSARLPTARPSGSRPCFRPATAGPRSTRGADAAWCFTSSIASPTRSAGLWPEIGRLHARLSGALRGRTSYGASRRRCRATRWWSICSSLGWSLWKEASRERA